MLKQYRASASYGRLNNRCLPYNTTAITDNSKFNLEKIADIYINLNQETAENHMRIKKTNRDINEPKDQKDEKPKSSSTCQSSECSTCGV